MIKALELAKTGKSKCARCKKLIGKTDVRGVEKYLNFGHIATRFYCEKCSMINLIEAKREINYLLNQLYPEKEKN